MSGEKGKTSANAEKFPKKRELDLKRDLATTTQNPQNFTKTKNLKLSPSETKPEIKPVRDGIRRLSSYR